MHSCSNFLSTRNWVKDLAGICETEFQVFCDHLNDRHELDIRFLPVADPKAGKEQALRERQPEFVQPHQPYIASSHPVPADYLFYKT